MSERAKHTGDPVADEAVSQQELRAATAARLRDLASYPIGLKTRVPNLPGARYYKAWPNDPNQQPYALLGHKTVSVLDVGGESDISGDYMRVNFQPRRHERQLKLGLSQIEDVFVDLRRGSAMPLHGSSVLPIGLTRHNGISILRWPSGVIESDTHERAEVVSNNYHPGIIAANFYNADGVHLEDGSTERISLERAKERASTLDVLTRTILLSRINDATYVATSRLGYDTESSVTVRKPKGSDEPDLHIEMVDYPKDTPDDALLDSHLSRHEEWSSLVTGQASFPDQVQLQPAIDSTLTYMMHD